MQNWRKVKGEVAVTNLSKHREIEFWCSDTSVLPEDDVDDFIWDLEWDEMPRCCMSCGESKPTCNAEWRARKGCPEGAEKSCKCYVASLDFKVYEAEPIGGN